MRRKITETLLKWKSDPNKKCLILTGSRQVGKTYILDEFAKTHYRQYLHLDFSLQPELRSIFSEDISADSIYDRLSVHYPGFKPSKDNSVLFLDEIQLCPGAMYAIKPLVADGRADIIASGSLLTVDGFKRSADGGNEWNPLDSIMSDCRRVSPMGYRDIIRLYALDFEEYLWALGMSETTTNNIRAHIRDKVPFDETSLKSLEQYFLRYLAIGGMPAVIADSLNGQPDWDLIDRECDRIRRDYIIDIADYSPPSITPRIRACIDSMPEQLGRDNRKFTYSIAERCLTRPLDNSGAREYKDAIRWIEGAGMATLCRNVTEPVLPLNNRHDGSMKMYCFDTGILISAFQSSMPNDRLRLGILSRNEGIDAGAIVENAVANMLEKCGFQLHYFERDKIIDADGKQFRDRIEIDFLVVLGDDLAAVEVKSGKNRRSGSMKKLRTDPRYTVYPVKRFIKLENGNIRVDENGVEHYPIFAAAFMDAMYAKQEVPPLPPLPEVVRRHSGALPPCRSQGFS